ncbi:hypothetical protein MRX96_037527 [Rhipicephalus microplus]
MGRHAVKKRACVKHQVSPKPGFHTKALEKAVKRWMQAAPGDPFLGLADEIPSEAEPMTGIESDSGTVTGKRPRDAEKKEKGTTAATPDEPPAKTTATRRPLLRPRPNISTERKTVETPPSPP